MQRVTTAAKRHPLLAACSVVFVIFAIYVAFLDWQITSRFDGRRWDLPAHVYARALELHVGRTLTADDLESELSRLGYRAVADRPARPGTFRRYRDRIELKTREFRFWDGRQPAQYLEVTFDIDRIGRLTDGVDEIPLGRLEPLMIGSLFPEEGEDRLIVAPDEMPPLLPAALKSVEDRRFEHHFGIDPVALLRATVANVRAGEITQGGSTLTQQLVKNYFLDNRKTFLRKFREAIMAIILELHYGKDEILNAYVNEVYLGQQGNRAIHGFGLASLFYFSRPLDELELHQVALLVALVRGPGYYDPVRFPERAMTRRNQVLEQMAKTQAISPARATQAESENLDLWDKERLGASYYPGYLQRVRHELALHYRDADLTQRGLRVFTALDPRVQATAEQGLLEGLAVLDDAPEAAPGLAGAVVVTSTQSGDLLAIVGGSEPGFAGFNRALHARRPIGSLVKPAVYLAALESGRFTLASTIDDSAVSLELDHGRTWVPANFDHESHGTVTLLRGLAESLNQATVRLGLEVGLERVAGMLHRLGFAREIPAYPSLLLGAVDMVPIEVAELYGTLANGGFRTPLQAVRSVIDGTGEPLERFPIEVEQAVAAETVYQLNEALVEVMHRGTGKSARDLLAAGTVVAGKTGTSDTLRDSWFAGFTGEHVMVVWVGYDDNRPTGLTGTTGALRIWASILNGIGSASYAPLPPPTLEQRFVQYETGMETAPQCSNAVPLALPPHTALPRGPQCGIDLRQLGESTVDWIRDAVN
ncbi:MAG: penicillin-binding protein 1B [Woeseiaceae bacterium]